MRKPEKPDEIVRIVYIQTGDTFGEVKTMDIPDHARIDYEEDGCIWFAWTEDDTEGLKMYKDKMRRYRAWYRSSEQVEKRKAEKIVDIKNAIDRIVCSN